MVLGLRSKKQKAKSVEVEYLIHIQEIKPWPQSQNLRSTQSVLLQWENGDQAYGDFTADVGDGKIEFNEHFRLLVSLHQESSRRSSSQDKFLKNCLEFYLYEPRKDKPSKSQFLGSAVINLADFGIIKENVTIGAPITFKKSTRNAVQSVLYVNIQLLDRGSSRSSPNANLSKEVSLDRSRSGSVSESMIEENAEGSIASFTDDEYDAVSSHSSRTITSSTFESTRGSPGHSDKLQNKSKSSKDVTGRISGASTPVSNVAPTNPNVYATVTTDSRKGSSLDRKGLEEATTSNSHVDSLEYEDKKEQPKNANNVKFEFSLTNQGENRDASTHARKGLEKCATSNTINELQASMPHRLEHLKSHNDSAKGNKFSDSQFMEEASTNVSKFRINNSMNSARSEGDKARNGISDSNVKMKSKIEILEEELREVAALEAGLYSVAAEHGSSSSKVHAPARRLSRFYRHVSQSKRASAARAAVSGLVLVSKACGNDVPRLTFWLSNSIVLRAIVSDAFAKLQNSTEALIKRKESEKRSEKRLSSKPPIFSPHKDKNNSAESCDEWEDPQTFVDALEKFESWIFSRIVESVWWQTLTLHMQSTAAKGASLRKSTGKENGLGDQDPLFFSIELWKKAFKDACERLCPIRAAGHECGCLPLLSKLVMKQLVNRLDVAMFNAILRESAEEMPTDPVSDPISDANVLPIPAGKSSFGAGVQLKNAIGNWSRWLSDLFDIDDTNSPKGESEVRDANKKEKRTSFKAFHLLNALSDLMMLPSDILGDRSTREEVCPMFSAPLIKRVLNNFVPDEFNPNPVPEHVFVALDLEDIYDVEDESITDFPVGASPTIYIPPTSTSVTRIVGRIGSDNSTNGSSLLRKSYTSDDELDELDSPLTLILGDISRTSRLSPASGRIPKGTSGRKVTRFKLLREVWKNGE